jgi:hypothetical protein
MKHHPSAGQQEISPAASCVEFFTGSTKAFKLATNLAKVNFSLLKVSSDEVELVSLKPAEF